MAGDESQQVNEGMTEHPLESDPVSYKAPLPGAIQCGDGQPFLFHNALEGVTES